jgi:energy-coupling factor transport system ATP-binding protein
MLFAPTVSEELSFGPKNLGYPADVTSRNVNWAVETVHLKSEMAMPPLALSFGQQKRISIAAILAMRSRILMMDEPTAGQDYWNYTAFMDAILQMPGFDSVIFITHDLDLALIYSNRILIVYDGRLVADGPAHDVLNDESFLRSCRIIPTSLLRVNRSMFPVTRKYYRAETLAHFQS